MLLSQRILLLSCDFQVDRASVFRINAIDGACDIIPHRLLSVAKYAGGLFAVCRIARTWTGSLLLAHQGVEVQRVHIHRGALLERLAFRSRNADTTPLSAFPDQHDCLLLEQFVFGVVRVEGYEHVGRMRAVLDRTLRSHHVRTQCLWLNLV